MMHGREKSDSAIVAGKPTNKAVSTAAEPVERRAEAKGNASQQSTRRTQSRVKCVTGAGAHTASRNENALPSHTQGTACLDVGNPSSPGILLTGAAPLRRRRSRLFTVR